MILKEELGRFISEELLSGRQAVGDGDNLLSEGMVDSLGMVRLVDFIQERFDVRVPPEDFTVENFRTLGVLTAYLERARGGEDGADGG